MKLLIGLGNPEEKYASSRHNVGHMVIDVINNQNSIDNIGHWKAEKTDVFMNDSGESVIRLKNFYKVDLDNLYIIYDDLDIPFGSYKISKGKLPRTHNGINSVVEKLGTEDFWHVRIGIDNRTGQREGAAGKEFVLSNFSVEELKILEKIIEKIGQQLMNP